MASANEAELRRWAEALSALARTGIGFTESEYERERYEEILSIAGDIKASADGEDALDLEQLFGTRPDLFKRICAGAPVALAFLLRGEPGIALDPARRAFADTGLGGGNGFQRLVFRGLRVIAHNVGDIRRVDVGGDS